MRPVATVTLPAIRLHPAPESAVIELLANISVPAGFGVLVTRFVLGIRDGIDWDHIAAITDITSTTAAAGMAEAATRSSTARLSGAASRPRRCRRDAGPRRGPGAATLAPVATISRAASSAPSSSRPFASARCTPWATVPSSSRSASPALIVRRACCPTGWTRSWADVVGAHARSCLGAVGAATPSSAYVRRGGESFRLRSRWMLVFELASATPGVASRRQAPRARAHVEPARDERVRAGGRRSGSA